MGADAPGVPGRNEPTFAEPSDFNRKAAYLLAELNEQAQERCRLIIRQMAVAEGVTEELKCRSQWEWVKAMDSIASRVEEIIKSEICNA